MERREAVELLSALPFLGALPLTPGAAQRAARFVRELRTAPGQAYAPKFFAAHEWQTVRLLADLVLPRDARSGSATDASVPEFMDFILVEYPDHQFGRALHVESGKRFGSHTDGTQVVGQTVRFLVQLKVRQPPRALRDRHLIRSPPGLRLEQLVNALVPRIVRGSAVPLDQKPAPVRF